MVPKLVKFILTKVYNNRRKGDYEYVALLAFVSHFLCWLVGILFALLQDYFRANCNVFRIVGYYYIA